MSGRTIGAGLGFLVGSMFGAPQLGMFIGSTLGGAIAPDTIEGNKVGNVPLQRSAPGAPQPVVLGTSLVDKCLVMSQGPDMIETETESVGKGSGQEVENEVLYRHFTVRVCRSSAAEDNQVEAIVAVYEYGKLVYDVRPNARISAADSAKWKANVTFYYGGPDQLTDPTEESYVGVGELSAHRQICRMVFNKKNLTEHGNAIPPYEVVVSRCGVAVGPPSGDPDIIDAFENLEFRFDCNPANWEAVGYCQVPSLSEQSFTLAGDGSTIYDVTLAITGSVESKDYTGGTPVEGEPRFLLGGVEGPVLVDHNSYLLDISNPPQRYWLNRTVLGTSERYTFTGEQLTVQVANDATVTFHGESNDGYQDPPSQWMKATVVSTTAGNAVPIPDAPGHSIDPDTGAITGPSPGVADMCGTTLAEVVTWLCQRGGLDADEIDVSELEGVVVRGITFQSAQSCKAELEPLRLSHFFDPSDFDSKLRFRLRGAPAVDMVINADHLIPTDDEDDETRIIGQDVEYPKRHHLEFLSLDLDYLRSTVTEERTSLDPTVLGEEQVSINEVFYSAEAKNIAAIQLKQAWMAREGFRRFGIPIEYIQLVGASLVELESRRGRVDGLRIDLNEIWLDPVPFDRASTYSANTVSPDVTPPSAPGSGIRGPSDVVVMNMPVYRDTDDKPGINWASRGYPNTAWRGARLQVQRGPQWLTLGEITQACGIGTLLSDLPAHAGDVDETNTLHLRMPEDMDSVTFSELLNERNPLAIVYPDGTVEVIQFQTATEITEGVWECTTLIRGRLDTVRGLHLAGARVVVLDNRPGFAQLRADDMGKTLTLRAVSLGTDPDLAPTFTITLATMESQREWQPYNITATRLETGTLRVDGAGRHRLGTDAAPVASQWWVGWRISFTFGGVTRTRMTRVFPFDYTVAMQTDDFGFPIGGSPTVGAVSVNEYTGGDGAGGEGVPIPASNPYAGFPPTIIGSAPNGYVGLPYYIPGSPVSGELMLKHNWPHWYANITGTFPPGITVAGDEPFGIPLSAGTSTWSILWLTNNGHVSWSQSITIAAKPSFAMLDFGPEFFVPGYNTPVRVDWNTVELGGGMRTFTGVATGKVRAEFAVTLDASKVARIGIHAGSKQDLALTGGGCAYHEVSTSGTYAVELDADTGGWHVRNSAGTSLASGTLSLVSAYDGLYRPAVWSDGGTVVFNAGNSAWATPVTSGYAGMPFGTVEAPVLWDIDTSDGTATIANGSSCVALGRNASEEAGDGLDFILGTFGKAAGKWRFRINCTTGQNEVQDKAWAGLCKSTTPTQAAGLGAAGATDSIGIQPVRWVGIPENHPARTNLLLQANIGGTTSSLLIPGTTADTSFVFAVDFTAGTCAIYVERSGALELLHTVTGLSGTWFPACMASKGATSRLIHNPAGPATFDNWTQTL